MEAAASAPTGHDNVEPEPREWQPRAIWVGGRLLCGSISFFFASFVFAFFYLQALDVNHNWKIGARPAGKGTRHLDHGPVRGRRRGLPAGRQAARGRRARRRDDRGVFTLAAVALQFFEYTQLGFGASQGGYASVFFGWTSLYAIVALMGVYWIWIQVASLWRVRREGFPRDRDPRG